MFSHSRPQVTVHQSPTTSHHSGDYAIPTLQHHLVQTHQQQQQQQQKQKLNNVFPIPSKYTPPYGPGIQPLGSNISSTGPPSVANFTSSAMSSPEFDVRNDDLYPHHAHPGTLPGAQQRLQVSAINPTHQVQRSYTSDEYSSNQDSPYLEDDQRHIPLAEQMRRTSATTTQTFQDTLQRVHTPPMSVRSPEQQFGPSYLAKDLSNDVREPPFNAGEFLNARGNMLGIDKTNLPRDSASAGQSWNHGKNQSQPKPNHGAKLWSGNIGRSESLLSTESSNSLDYKGPSQLEEDPHKLMAEGARYQAPTPQAKRARQPYEKSHDFSDKYLMRADEIRMKELNRSASGTHRSREETDGYPVGHPHNNRNWTQEEREQQPFQHGAVPVMMSYGPQVHMSHSTAVQNGYNLSGEYDSDRQYDVPPNREEKQFLQSQHSIYKCPAPTYAAPPPPSSDEDQPLPPSNTHPQKGPQEHRLHILPLPPSASLPPTRETISSSDITTSRQSSVPTAKPIPIGSGPIPVPPPSIPGFKSVKPTNPTHSTNPAHSTPTKQQPSLLESSSSSSISSNWSIDHMGRHFEKLANGFGDLLAPLDEEKTTTAVQQQELEGTVGVDWDMPSGPHMSNGHPTKSKPQVTQKPHLTKKHSNGMPRAFRSGGRGGNNHGNNGYSADEEGPGVVTSAKKRVKVPEPSLRIDPRQPILKVKKVQGSAWRQETVNKAIESSSEESDDSSCSDDTVVAGNTDTLRSAHV